MTDFYIGVHSDASIGAFPANRVGNFKTILSKEIDLGTTPYNVAISSITRYYETSMDDLVVIREKRTPKPYPGLEIPTTYPTNAITKTNINARWDDFIKNYPPMIALQSKEYTAKFTVQTETQEFTIFKQPIYKSDLEMAVTYKSGKVRGATFELFDMLGVGNLTVVGYKGLDKDKGTKQRRLQ